MPVTIREAIPAGLQLHITTWENDGDNYSTQVFSGLTQPDAVFLLSMASKFKSSSRGGMGNEEQPDDVLIELVQEALDANPFISLELRKRWEESIKEDEFGEYSVHEMFVRLLGETIDYEGYDNWCRVFESFKIYEFTADVPAVVIPDIKELAVDVTKNFPAF